MVGCRLDGENLLNHKQAATTKVAIASPNIAVGHALFQAGEEATNQASAKADGPGSSNSRVEAAKQRIVDQFGRDALDDKIDGTRPGFDAATVHGFGVHLAAILQPDC